VSLADYVDDIRAVAAELPERAVLIGHSMGARWSSDWSRRSTSRGGAGMPVPPSGLLPVLTRLWWGRPDFFWHAQRLQQAVRSRFARHAARVLLHADAPREVLAEPAITYPESSRAVMELAWRGTTARPGDHDTPICVVAAAPTRCSPPRMRMRRPPATTRRRSSSTGCRTC
jgi:pimeloyl-ACP methyl ester carboxylesterase